MPKVEILINVIDADAVRKLKALHQTARDSFRGVAEAGRGAGGSGLSEANKEVRGLSEAMHLVHPVLRAAGLEIGGFREYFAAARAGALAFAAALVAAVTVGLYNVGAEAEKTKRKIDALFGGGQQGKEAYGEAKKAAAELHRPVESVGADLQILQDIEQKRRVAEQRGFVGPEGSQMTFPEHRVTPEGKVEPWTPPPGSAVEKAFPLVRTPSGMVQFDENLKKLLRGGGASAKGADETTTAILTDLNKQMDRAGATTPMLTPEIWQKIYNASPQAAGRLAKGMGFESPQQVEAGLGPGGGFQQTLDQFSNLLKALEQTANQDFKNRPPPTAGEKWDEIKNDFVLGTTNFKDAVDEFKAAVGERPPVASLHAPGLIAKPGAALPAVSPKGIIPITLPELAPPGAPSASVAPGAAGVTTPAATAAAPAAPSQAAAAPSATVTGAPPPDNGGPYVAGYDKKGEPIIQGQARGAATKSQATTAPPPLPDYFPQGQGSGLRVTAVPPSPPAAAPAPGAIPAPLVQPEARGAAPAVAATAPPGASPGPTTPATAPSRQTAIVTRGPNGELRVIQPDAEGHARGGPVGDRTIRIPGFALGGLIGRIPGYAGGGDLNNDDAPGYDADQRYEREKLERARAGGARVAPWSSFLQGHFAGAGPFNPKANALGAQMFINKAQLIGAMRNIRSGFANAFGPSRRWSPAGGGQWTQGEGMAEGGPIRGPGTSTSDSITGEFEQGGYILNARASFRAGRSTLDSLHAFGRRFALGGKIVAHVSDGEEYFTRVETQRIGLANLQTLNRAGGGPISLTDEMASPVQFPSSVADNPGSRESGSGYELHLHMNKNDPPVAVSTDRDSLERVERAAMFDRMLNIVPNSDAVR